MALPLPEILSLLSCCYIVVTESGSLGCWLLSPSHSLFLASVLHLDSKALYQGPLQAPPRMQAVAFIYNVGHSLGTVLSERPSPLLRINSCQIRSVWACLKEKPVNMVMVWRALSTWLKSDRAEGGLQWPESLRPAAEEPHTGGLWEIRFDCQAEEGCLIAALQEGLARRERRMENPELSS